MPDFDIGTLLDFHPPKMFCEKCKGLLFGLAGKWPSEFVACPVCSVKYLQTKEFSVYRASDYIKEKGLNINLGNPIEQGRNLAAIAYNFNRHDSDYPPMRALFEAISTATSFIHFTTYGLSKDLYGAIKLKSQSIPVRGIVANMHPDFAREVRQNDDQESPRLELLLFERGNWSNQPHQKLLIIDGLLAFKGAANLTDRGWRNVASGHDYIEVVTNVQEIASLHNRLFSPIWAEYSEVGTEIIMSVIPF